MLKLKFSKVHSVKTFLFSLFSLSAISGLYLLFSSVILISCNPTEPDDIKPGRRDYTWTVDTIKIDEMSLTTRGIWGSSPNDVWVIVNWGGLSKTMWHYNGFSWTTDDISRGIEPHSIYGFSNSDIWAAGWEGHIWHYNGQQWSFNYQYLTTGFRSFSHIWGDRPNNIYAVGYADSANVTKAIILHYDGKNWSKKIIPDYLNHLYMYIQRDLNNGLYYLEAYDMNGTEISLFEYDGNTKLKKIYESRFSSMENNAMVRLIGSRLYFLIGYKINRYENQEFKPFIDINEPEFGGQFWGRNEKDIFLRMFDGVAHYNGSDIQYILRFNEDESISVGGVALFEKECFVLAEDDNTGYGIIYRGKLN